MLAVSQVICENEQDVARYYSEYPGLEQLVRDVCHRVSDVFGVGTSLYLQESVSPDDGHAELVVWIMARQDVEAALDLFDQVVDDQLADRLFRLTDGHAHINIACVD